MKLQIPAFHPQGYLNAFTGFAPTFPHLTFAGNGVMSMLLTGCQQLGELDPLF